MLNELEQKKPFFLKEEKERKEKPSSPPFDIFTFRFSPPTPLEQSQPSVHSELERKREADFNYETEQ